MYTDNEITITLTEEEWATIYYAWNRELSRQVENFSHEESGRKGITEIEDAMERFREQAMEQGMNDPADNV